MNDKRRGLGRGLGALIPQGGGARTDRPVDVFFPGAPGAPSVHAAGQADAGPGTAEEPGDVSRETPALVATPGARFAQIAIERIAPNPRQPRQVFDEDQLAELTASIR